MKTGTMKKQLGKEKRVSDQDKSPENYEFREKVVANPNPSELKVGYKN